MDFQQFKQLYNFNNDYYAFALFVQAHFETGAFKSRLSVELNNLYGMGIASKRPQQHLIVGSESIVDGGYNRKVAVYSSKAMSVQDRIELDIYNNIQPPKSANDTLRWINEVEQKGYATSTSYVKNFLARYNLLASDYGVAIDMDSSVNPDGVIYTTPTIQSKLKKIFLVLLPLLGVGAYFYYRRRKKNK